MLTKGSGSVMELVDKLDLNSGAVKAWEFEPPLTHHFRACSRTVDAGLPNSPSLEGSNPSRRTTLTLLCDLPVTVSIASLRRDNPVVFR